MAKMSRVVAIDIECANCQTINSIPGNHAEFWSDNSECGMCGSHGKVDLIVNIDCRGCHKDIDNIEVSHW